MQCAARSTLRHWHLDPQSRRSRQRGPPSVSQVDGQPDLQGHHTTAAFLTRSLDHLAIRAYLDATYVEARNNHRIISRAVVVATRSPSTGTAKCSVSMSATPKTTVLDRVPAHPARPRPHRSAPGDLRRPRRAESGYLPCLLPLLLSALLLPLPRATSLPPSTTPTWPAVCRQRPISEDHTSETRRKEHGGRLRRDPPARRRPPHEG